MIIQNCNNCDRERAELRAEIEELKTLLKWATGKTVEQVKKEKNQWNS